MGMIKWGLQNADRKMRMEIANDNVRMIKFLWGKLTFDVFFYKLKLVNKPDHYKELRLGEGQYFFYSITKQIQTFLRRPNKKKRKGLNE